MRKKYLIFMTALFAIVASVTLQVNAMHKIPKQITFHFANSKEEYRVPEDKKLDYQDVKIQEKNKCLLLAALKYVELLDLIENEFLGPLLAFNGLLNVHIPFGINKKEVRQAVKKICKIQKAGQGHHLISEIKEITQTKEGHKALKKMHKIIKEYHIVKALDNKCKILKYLVACGIFVSTGAFLYSVIKNQNTQIDLLQKKINTFEANLPNIYAEVKTERDICKKTSEDQINLLKEELKKESNNCKESYNSHKKATDEQTNRLIKEINTLEAGLANANKKIKQESDNCKEYCDSYKNDTEKQINRLTKKISTYQFKAKVKNKELQNDTLNQKVTIRKKARKKTQEEFKKLLNIKYIKNQYKKRHEYFLEHYKKYDNLIWHYPGGANRQTLEYQDFLICQGRLLSKIPFIKDWVEQKELNKTNHVRAPELDWFYHSSIFGRCNRKHLLTKNMQLKPGLKKPIKKT